MLHQPSANLKILTIGELWDVFEVRRDICYYQEIQERMNHLRQQHARRWL